ncbi:MAG: bifunctional phosphoribosyl-AMP cyclohydrolase/phosphoribosyl-ATP diphosphatase HisIE [Pseudomonadota bacterium]
MIDPKILDWKKSDGLLPAVIQDADNKAVLMLGYMNAESLKQTLDTKKVTFFSRSKQALWVKGEISGNYLNFISVEIDCDKDTILIQAKPEGPVCHTGTRTCFNNEAVQNIFFLQALTTLINQRKKEMPEGSYTTSLFESGVSRMAQKVGEEGVELSLAAVKDDREEIMNEAADLLFHMMVLLEAKGLSVDDICKVLISRHGK